MTLISDLGSRTTVSSTGKRDTRKWGLFECPSCGSKIELKMYKGINNKTCGKAGCRVVDRAGTRKIDADKLKTLPYYSSFTDFYRRIKNNVDHSWGTVAKFRDSMYESYKELRDTGSKATLFISDSGKFHAGNCKWVDSTYTIQYDFSKDSRKHSLMLAEELGTSAANILRTLKKLKDFGEYSYETLGCPGYLNRPYKAYFFNNEQYTRLRDVIMSNIKATSDNVYLMECEGFHKIGISSNVSSRLSSLDGSTPFDVKLVFTKYIENARSIEKRLHMKYSTYNVKKEWFNLTEEQVTEIITYLDNKE